jgi:peroxiredoxin Q/BCP
LIRLSDFEGKKLVLYFYPKDNTPGCTAEACDLRDNYNTFLKKGFAVVGVSMDSEISHRKFAEKFPFLSRLLQIHQKRCWKTMMYGKKKVFTGRLF